MRLNSIKLSGFKSFAEATHFALPGQMVGVVGPNGCGKSNIMDAVRWVLGESRASELRGQAMQDVIFSGTLHRKPASRASVELLFDNADQRASGPWGQFAEISVRRTVTRDGSSGYFLNNQAVRRRDVQDLFLGTGLGPRAYAIIGQGTISRIVEARPEDLRLFLEEAAGVSRYKERRRETENRLDGTATNLARVQDILREMQARLDQLQQQAELAERHEHLHQQHTQKQQQLWHLRMVRAQEELERVRSEGLAAVQALEQQRAGLEQHRAQAQDLHVAQDEARRLLEAAQDTVGQARAEVVRLETDIRHVLDNRERAGQRVQHIGEQLAHWQQDLEEAQRELAQVQQQDALAQEEEALARARLEEQQERLPQLEEALEQAQQAHEQQRASAAQAQQALHLLAAEQRAIHGQRDQHQQRLARLRDQARDMAAAGPDPAHLARMQSQRDEAQEAGELLAAQLAQMQDDEPLLHEARSQQQQVVNEEGARHAQLAARLQALQALQEKLQAEDHLQPWLQKHGLDGLEALWRRITVEPGWEDALDAALRDLLGALQVGRLETLCGLAEHDAPPARLTFFSPPAASGPETSPAAAAHAVPLLHWLRTEEAALHALLADWLHGCHTAPDLHAALARRGELGAQEVIYLPRGHAVRRHSISFHAPDAAGQGSMLARAQEIARLHKHLRAQELVLQEARTALVRSEHACQDMTQRLASARRQATQAQSRAHELQVQTLQLAQQAEQARLGRVQIEDSMAETQAQIEELDMQAEALDERFGQLDVQLAGHQARSEQAAAQWQRARQQAQMAREQLRALERQAQEAGFACRSARERCSALARTLETARQQADTLAQEQQAASAELERLHRAAAPQGLERAQQRLAQCEQAASACRHGCEEIEARLRAADARRQQLEQGLEPLRQRIQELQLQEQKAHLGAEQYAQFLQESGADLAALGQTAAPVHAHALQAEMEQLQAQITALGPVNLAAVQELRAARERETFLAAQAQDLAAAMETLQAAIRRMDEETRELLGSTFERVNQHLAQMFTLLFGGGQARLTIHGDDLLDCGVQIMAQPPGKKNQTIHLLSGGEKALCAIALVFAMFQLNPAPFCLLDEVDAPLDDANTGRYARLVASMSANTQFLFISHNRIAMERADQLIGVTMQEQGVSRIVAVDVHAGLDLAGSSP